MSVTKKFYPVGYAETTTDMFGTTIRRGSYVAHAGHPLKENGTFAFRIMVVDGIEETVVPGEGYKKTRVYARTTDGSIDKGFTLYEYRVCMTDPWNCLVVPEDKVPHWYKRIFTASEEE